MKSNWLAFSLAGSILLVIDSLKPAVAFNVTFTDFSDISSLTLNGNAAQSGTVLRLTPNLNGQVGTAFYSIPFAIDVDTSFTSNFQFQILGGTGGADGFTFMVQNDTNNTNAIGINGSGLGYQGIANNIAVEFDTWTSGGDLNNNHIGINTNGFFPSISTAIPAQDINSGSIFSAWVDYDGSTNQLDIFFSDNAIKPGTALLSDTLDLSNIVGSQGYIGFSASTGGARNSHDILNLEFSSTAAVPFKFSPGLGILVVGGIFGISLLQKKLSSS